MYRFRNALTFVALACLVGAAFPILPEARGVSAGDGGSAALSAAIADAPPLHDKRVGVSQSEPDYCGPELTRETNPNAANRSSIEVGPPKFLVEDLAESRVWRHCISVLNRFDEQRIVELSTLDVVGSLDPDVTVETRDEPGGAGAWIELPVQRLELEPGERALVPYLLRLPDEMPVGTVVGAIRVTDVTNAAVTGGTRITRSLVSQLQITSPGGEARDLDIRSVRSTRFIWTGRDPEVIRATFTAVNQGTVLDTMEGRLVVDGLFGREVADIGGTPDVVLPSSAQRVTLRWDGVPFMGIYFPELRVKSTTGTRTVDLPNVIVLPPWPYIVGLVLALAMLVFGMVRRRRNAWREYLEDEDGADDDDGFYEDGQ